MCGWRLLPPLLVLVVAAVVVVVVVLLLTWGTLPNPPEMFFLFVEEPRAAVEAGPLVQLLIVP